MKVLYQTNFSELYPAAAGEKGRLRKARTTLAILEDYLGPDLGRCFVLNVGCSTAVIDKFLAEHVSSICAMDIDQAAVKTASTGQCPKNLTLLTGNAQQLPFSDNLFDVVVCSHVYEHVPDAEQMMGEIRRTLKAGGICYFAAGNRLAVQEPHYHLPFLSYLPAFLAHAYLKLIGRGDYYYEKHRTYWGLKTLSKYFDVQDYTVDIIKNPAKYKLDYLIKPGSVRHRVAIFFSMYLLWLLPGYIWILKKPSTPSV